MHQTWEEARQEVELGRGEGQSASEACTLQALSMLHRMELGVVARCWAVALYFFKS